MKLPRLAIPAREMRPGWAGGVKVRVGRRFQMLAAPPVIRQPFIVSYGMGTDSTALLVLLALQAQEGDETARPDLIQFADTGSEKDETYAYLEHMDAFLAKHGMPLVTLVKRNSGDDSLADKCLRLRTMPSLAYGGKSCSLFWKAETMEQNCNRWMPALLAWHSGMKVLRAIGYDAGKADSRRSRVAEDEKVRYLYPLRDAGLVREACIHLISYAGLPQPGKSACYMCPASKRHEVTELARRDPMKMGEALMMEARALLRTAQEKDKFTTRGLGRRWAWRDHLAHESRELLQRIIVMHPEAAGEAEWQQYLALAGDKILRTAACGDDGDDADEAGSVEIVDTSSDPSDTGCADDV